MTRKLARPMVSAIFVTGGLDSLRSPAPKAPVAEDVAIPVAEAVGLPTDTELLVRINGAVQLGAGLLFAAGRLPRLSALALAATLVPTTLAAHRFWELEDDGERHAQQIQFLKNLSIFGGLVLASLDTGGRPSLPWRARRGARRTRTVARKATEALPPGD